MRLTAFSQAERSAEVRKSPKRPVFDPFHSRGRGPLRGELEIAGAGPGSWSRVAMCAEWEAVLDVEPDRIVVRGEPIEIYPWGCRVWFVGGEKACEERSARQPSAVNVR